ncbi:MAG: hypothetical protein JWM05_2457 [Acidimicrobiales bacterium]|nr:hypothetical protein [Acidimicrobiales bacterium]
MRWWLLAGLLMAVFCAGAATLTAASSTNSQTRAVVAFAGDSNISLAAGSINLWLTDGYHANNGYVPVFASRVGASIRTADCLSTSGCTTYDYWRLKLGTLSSKVQADGYVTDLGINDTVRPGQANTPGYASYGQKIDWLMKLLPAGKPVFWSNLPCSIEPPSRQTGCQAVNQALADARSRWAKLTVIDWASKANGHPEYMSSPGQDVHLSATGQVAWGAAVIRALDARFPPK